jgi:prolyl 4-hydroxylase
MKKIKINSDDTHFIGCWNLENDNLCNKIIEFFKNNKSLQTQGASASGVNTKIKKTIDISIKPNDLKKEKFEIFKQYMSDLHKCFLDYQNQWPFLKTMIKNVYIPSFNIQRYEKGDHFALLHSERTNLSTSHRLFAWMTYLNDVDDGGQTNFSHYGIKIKPQTGKTLIWPAEWTHAHTGEILKGGTKYIVTGWIHFPVPDQIL